MKGGVERRVCRAGAHLDVSRAGQQAAVECPRPAPLLLPHLEVEVGLREGSDWAEDDGPCFRLVVIVFERALARAQTGPRWPGNLL